MTIDPQVLRSEQFTEIGRLIQRDAGLLIQRWSQRAAQEQPDAGRTHHHALLDHLPEFLAVLAHELRNPLAPILNSVEVLRLLGPADPNVVRARDIVERQVKQMVRLVDDLLDVTRIAQGKVELRRTDFDLATAVAEAI